jgi:hypothetical protein
MFNTGKRSGKLLKIFEKIPTGKALWDEDTCVLKRLINQPFLKGPVAKVSRDDIAEILYAGETKKFAKGVPIQHFMFLECADEQLSVGEPMFPRDENLILDGIPLFNIPRKIFGRPTSVWEAH